MRLNQLSLLLGAAILFSGALQASSVYNYGFGGLGNIGSNTKTFSPSSGPNPNITAIGFKPGTGSTVTAANLYSKGSVGFPPPNDESGLGLVNDPTHDNEITSGSFIMLDLGNLSISSLGVYTESTTDGEEWKIWGSNTPAFAGQSFTIPGSGLTGTGEGDQNVTSLAGDRYIFITAVNGNVLLGGITATATNPEPSSAGLAGLAFVGCGLLFRRRISKKIQQS